MFLTRSDLRLSLQNNCANLLAVWMALAMLLNPDALTHSYDVRLVALSIVIAILAAHAALDLAGRTTAARGKLRIVWLACGALAMGFGIWAMHYIGMLALKLGVPILYDFPTVLFSLFAAIFGAATALWIVSRKELTVISVASGSLVMGSAIAAMHYIGMAAMRMPAMCHYNPTVVGASILIAVVVSAAALPSDVPFPWCTKRISPRQTF